MQERRLQQAQRLHFCLLAFLSILAVRLLQFRDWARAKPHLRAAAVFKLLVQITGDKRISILILTR